MRDSRPDFFVKFHLDVSTGDVLHARLTNHFPGARLAQGFAGIAGRRIFQQYHQKEQFAEKLHAYTLPRVGRENSRVKDLVDLILLIERAKLDTTRLPRAVRETFQRRKTHEIPVNLASPPASWSRPFAEMAAECGLEPAVGRYFDVVTQFFRKLGL